MPKINNQNKYQKFKDFKCCNNKHLTRHGHYKRKSDSRDVFRFKCQSCKKTVSYATFDKEKWQKKRQFNHQIKMMLASNMSMRRIAKLLHIDNKTVARTLAFLGKTLKAELNQADLTRVYDVQFDELQTIEHNKCKPLSVVMAVSRTDRRILNFEVSSMPATGYLARISRIKYGPRPDDRSKGLDKLFSRLAKKKMLLMSLSSDECSQYKPAVKKAFSRNYVSAI